MQKLFTVGCVFFAVTIIFYSTSCAVDDKQQTPTGTEASAPVMTSAPSPSPTPALTPDSSQSETMPMPDDGDEPLPVEAPPTPIPQARDLTDTLTVTISNEASPANLLDRDYNTKRSFGEGVTVEITADEPIHSLYVIWDEPPGGGWRLTDATTRIMYIYGEHGFIHEYISGFAPTTDVVIRLPEDGAVLCDIYAFSEGTPPEWVQTWAPPLEKADLLVIPTHADDEHLFFVGVLPYYAGERGLDVQVAYMTNHWNEQPRPHELLNGLWTVGITNYPYISQFRDRMCDSLQEAVDKFGHENVVNFHVELLRRFKPSVVAGHDIDGEYGHGAHMLNARALIEAVEKAADSDYHPASFELYGTWDTPKLYLHLYRDNRITMDWDTPLEFFDGATARDMAIRGYDCHISQHKWSFSVPREDSGRITGSVFGLVRSLVGPDIIGGDMFENIS